MKNEMKCKSCGHTQEFKSISRISRFDKKLNKIVYKVNDEWITHNQVCEKCQSTDLTKDFASSNLDESAEMRNRNSNKYWKKGKSDAQVAAVIAGDTEPY
tara:strand:+ start:533 stop:832 length:300 start_codon:yes stop_codon:yes gene_type:complete